MSRKRRGLAPHPALDLDDPRWGNVVLLSWSEWRDLYGGGLRSWLRWFLREGLVEGETACDQLHRRWERVRLCHRYRGTRYCYCQED